MPVWLYIVLFGLVSSLGLGGWKYVEHINEERNTLQLAKTQLEQDKKGLEHDLLLKTREASDKARRESALSAKLETSQEQVGELRNLFNDHDFAALARAKPGLINRRMQSATDKLWLDFEYEANRSRSTDKLPDGSQGVEPRAAENSPSGR